MIQAEPTECTVFDGASRFNFAFLILITLGIILSYVPQYHRIYVKKTSEGLSTTFLLLGSCSSIFTFTNIVLISSKARRCCYMGELNTFNCLSSQLSLLQIGVQCVCAVLILVLVLIITKHSIKQDKEEYKRIIIVGKFVALHGIASLIQILFGLGPGARYLNTISSINGLLSTLLTIIKYVPQIYTTYHLKHPGTLSIGMMCIQTPGGAIFTATLFFTKGSHWSSWVSYFVAFILQGTLLTLCIYYEYFKNHGITAELSEIRNVERIVEENFQDEISPANESTRLSS